MTRQADLAGEERREKFDRDVLLACYGGLESALRHAGAELLGFSYKASDVECLLTLRVAMPGGRQVGFVGGETLAGCLRKAMLTARQDGIRWRVDKWAE